MSYIRSNSNPEKLYIYGSDKGLIICSPFPEKDFICDFEDFYQFVKQWYEYQDDEFEYKYFAYKYRQNKNNDFKVFLKISGYQEIEMWYVTWMYIVNNMIARMVEKDYYEQLFPEE